MTYPTNTLARALLVLCAAIAPAQYSQRVWQSTDGLPEDFAQALAQTPEGYLWIGTSGGLVRFDGTRFRVFHRENEPAFRDDSVYSLLTARDGTLWIGSEGGGLIRYRAGVFRAFGAKEGLTNGFVRVIFEDKDLGLWVGTDRGLFRMEREALVRVNQMAVHSICQDRVGRLLIGGSGLLVLNGPASKTPSEHYRSTANQADNSIRTIRETRDGTLWIGTISGLRRLDRGLAGDPFPNPRMIEGMNISSLREGHDGSLWIGTYGQGLMRYASGRIERLTLPHNNVLALFGDNEDDVWVGTQGGLVRLSRSAATAVTTADGRPQSINTIYQDPRGPLYVAGLNGSLFEASSSTLVPAKLPAGLNALPIRNVFRDRSGELWLGTDGQGVVRGTARYSTKDGLVSDFVRAFCEDRDGSIWIGTDGGLSRWRAGKFQNFNTQDGLVYGSIRALLLASDGDVWVATDGGLSRFHSSFHNPGFVADPLADRLRGEKIWSLHADSEGGLWVGTHGAGLWLLSNGNAAQFTVKDGLLSNSVHHIAEDAQGNLWMSGPGGIVSVSRRELQNRNGQLAVRVYGTSEGLTTNQMNGGVQPAGAMTPSGELWFASAKGAVRIEPAVQDRGSRPPVVIEQVLADDRPVDFAAGLRAGPGEGKLEIHYTAIRLRSPERTQFKYWMEGFERDWTDAGQRRIAYYTNLTAGSYRFHVVAYERHDPRNAAEQILRVEWRPHFYQTEWFLALCGLAAISVAWGGYRLHVRNLRSRFAAVLEERNRLAREMHDTVIQGCVGVSTLLEAASHAQDVSPGVGRDLLDRARNEVRATVDEARLAVWNLRNGSPSADDLVAEVSDLAQRIGAETGVPVRFEKSGLPVRIGAEGERSLLMLIREALYNAVRHAQPTELAVILRFERGGLQVEVHDDGCGFDPSLSGGNGHYGLIGMRERVEKLGGEFRIASEVGKGTKVLLRIRGE